MFSKKDTDPISVNNKTLTIIGEGVVIEGNLYSPGTTRIDGIVNGEIIAEKEIIIGKEGKVEAKIKTKDATIAGTFMGNMVASGEVEISSSGRFTGNLIQKDALLTIEKGGVFKGESVISEDQKIFEIKGEERKSILLNAQKIQHGEQHPQQQSQQQSQQIQQQGFQRQNN
ncbi:MAG: polymer-forming cytoskeletal protein [Actinobacteria bacterium]|nr:polymer-forming cytoskeletal protein [Actinomycetota bacterium]